MSSKPAVSKVETNTKQTRGPLPEAAPLWSGIWNSTGNALTAPQPQTFVAPPTPAQLSSVDQILAAAPSLGAAGPSLSDMATKVASGFFLNPANDPTFAGAADAAIRPITRQLTENVLPLIQDKSIRNSGAGTGPGAYGGARQDIQQNQALTDWATTAGDITGELANKSRNAGLSLIPHAGSIAASGDQQILAPATATGLAGQQQQQWDQAAIDAAIKDYMFGFAGPQAAANIGGTGGFFSGSTDSTATTTGPAPDMATQWLQGLSGGAAGLNSLFGAAGAFPSVFASLGAGGTAAAGAGAFGAGAAPLVGAEFMAMLPFMLSDRRLKTDIEPVGKLFDGTVVYRFRYNNSPNMQLGLMADELDPSVVRDVNGIKFVDYEKATDKSVEIGG